MRTIMLVFGLLLIGSAQVGLPTEALAQVGSSISADGSPPNDNAMLDVKSPMSGAGKGILIPRISENQRTNANGSVEGGLLDTSGNLRGGAAQGLIVYQTENPQGLYFNTSPSATPSWAYLGDVGGYLLSNVWALANATTNYLPRTGGTMSGTLNMGGQIVSNVASIDFNGTDVSVGREANGSASGAAIGYQANGASNGAAVGVGAIGTNNGAVVGWNANGSDYGVALGRIANGANYGAAAGYLANGAVTGVAVGASANGYANGAAIGKSASGTNYGAAVGWSANGSDAGAAVGLQANGYNYGAAMGWAANGSSLGAAMGWAANGYNAGAAMGWGANGRVSGAAVGQSASGTNYGAAVGRQANGVNNGVAVGYLADGNNDGTALGSSAAGNNNGTAVGYASEGYNLGAAVGVLANGAQTNVAIGVRANAQGGTQRIAIGNGVTNAVNESAVIRGTLYLDGGTSNIYYRYPFNTGSWSNKAFEIDHPLDPGNKILRHFCLEGPQVWNVYAGNAQLVNGQAVIELPDYYSALNLVGSEIYGLTPIGGRADIWIQQEVSANCFLIQGEKDIKVSWTIKVLRNDPGCQEDLQRRPVEEWKK